MAVQLARLSLWLLTLAADRPLTFLDHHLQAGDSLLGAWLACLRHAPATHRREPECRAAAVRHAGVWRGAARQRCRSASRWRLPAATPLEQVREKERLLAALIEPRFGAWRNGSASPTCGARVVRPRACALAGVRQPLRLNPDRAARALRTDDRPDPSCTRCRAGRRRRGDSFTGSWNFRKCSSTRAAIGSPAPASTPSSAIRRGT